MKICVSEDLREIKKELKNLGYEIVTINNGEGCDAYICDLKNGGLSSLGYQSNIKREGMLIIDIGSKSVNEIEQILNNRLYSSMF